MMISDVTCPVCGCGCDDIRVQLDDSKIAKVYGVCIMGQQKFRKSQSPERITKPLKKEDGKFVEISWDDAINEAAEILSKASHSLFYGWSETSCEAMKVGIDLAELTHGFIDGQSSHCHGPSIIGEQSVGIPSCTLGMVMNYADLVIYWGSNPIESHPRHMSRFSTYPRGIYSGEGRRDRKIVVIDTRKTLTANVSNLFFQIKPNSDFELISALRMVLNGKEIPDEVAGLNREEITKLADTMKNCGYGVVFVGLGLTHSKGKSNNVENLYHLVRRLNDFTRFNVIPMRGHYNVAGLNQVLTWRTGYPFAVDFFRGYPCYNPGETSVIDILARGEVDAMLSISSDPVSHFPKKCVEHLAEIPIISMDIVRTPTTELSDLVIPGVITGIDAVGTYYRMDNIPLIAKKIIEPPFDFTHSDEETLKKIYDKILEKKKK